MYKLLLIILLIPTLSSAESLLQISVPMANRVFFQFDTYPKDATSSLSEDKKQIILKIPGTDYKGSKNTFVGKGKISSIDISYQDNTTNIYINLNEQSGYTIAPLKSVNICAVETFNWSKIDKQEDIYRNSLLAYESGLTEVALEDLAKSNYKNSQDILTDILFKTKDYDAAVKSAFKAYNQSNMPVHLAVLAEIARNLDDTTKTNAFLRQMSSITGLDSIGLNKSYKLSIKSLDNQYRSELDSLKLNTDSTTKDNEHLIAEKRFKNIFPSDSIMANDSTIVKSLLFKDFYGFPWWTEYVLYIILTGALLVVYLYLRWRNKQLLALKEFSEKKRKIDDRKEKAKKYHKESTEVEEDIEKGLADRKQKHKTGLQKDKSKSEPELTEAGQSKENRTKFSAEMLRAKQAYSEGSQNAPDQKKVKNTKQATKENIIPTRDKRANKIEQIIDAIRSNSNASTIVDKPKSSDYSGLSAKMQLAMKITEEEMKEKNKQLSKLENLTDEELETLARELGTGKASIETKKNVQDLLGSKEAMDELAKKFNKRE